MLTLTINGQSTQVPPLNTLQDLIGHLGYEQKKIVVAINLHFIPKSQYPSIQLKDNDQLEILSAVQGG